MTYAEETLARAVFVLGDVRADEDDREDAARVILILLRRAYPTERDIAEVIGALSRALDVDLAIRRVLGELQRLPPVMVEKAGRGVERLMLHAFRDGRCGPLQELILVALEEPAWAVLIRDEWARTALADAINHLPETKYPAVLLISGWLAVRGGIPGWMRELVEERPDLVSSTLLPPATRWQLHRAAPTVTGWKALASVRGPGTTLEPSMFGGQCDVAVATLEQALGETVDDAGLGVLRGWLHELTGVDTSVGP